MVAAVIAADAAHGDDGIGIPFGAVTGDCAAAGGGSAAPAVTTAARLTARAKIGTNRMLEPPRGEPAFGR
jgi:hypothetical protein